MWDLLSSSIGTVFAAGVLITSIAFSAFAGSRLLYAKHDRASLKNAALAGIIWSGGCALAVFATLFAILDASDAPKTNLCVLGAAFLVFLTVNFRRYVGLRTIAL